MAFCKNCGKEIKDGEKCSCEKETKFCKSCGKKLVGNEPCDCGGAKKTTESSSNFDFVGTMKDIKDDLLAIWKKPVDVIKANTGASNLPKTIIVLVLIALSFGLFVAGIVKNMNNVFIPLFAGLAEESEGLLYAVAGLAYLLVDPSSSKMMDKIAIPYVKIIFFAMLIMAAIMAIYALVMLIIPAIFKNKKVNYLEGLSLTVSANLPMIWANVICAVLAFVGLDVKFVLIPWLVVNMIAMYNLICAYAQHAEVKENKFAYIITVLVAVSGLISGICAYIAVPSMVESVGDDIVDAIEDYNDDKDSDVDWNW